MQGANYRDDKFIAVWHIKANFNIPKLGETALLLLLCAIGTTGWLAVTRQPVGVGKT
jgi:hypothetical protein